MFSLGKFAIDSFTDPLFLSNRNEYLNSKAGRAEFADQE